MSHHHLTRDERVALAAYLRAGHSKSECARLLGVHRSTITREVERAPGEYRAIGADKHARQLRNESKRSKRKIENDIDPMRHRMKGMLTLQEDVEKPGHFLQHDLRWLETTAITPLP